MGWRGRFPKDDSDGETDWTGFCEIMRGSFWREGHTQNFGGGKAGHGDFLEGFLP